MKGIKDLQVKLAKLAHKVLKALKALKEPDFKTALLATNPRKLPQKCSNGNTLHTLPVVISKGIQQPVPVVIPVRGFLRG